MIDTSVLAKEWRRPNGLTDIEVERSVRCPYTLAVCRVESLKDYHHAKEVRRLTKRIEELESK